MDILYPELKAYINEYCEEFMTADELMARRTLMYTASTTSEGMLAAMRKRGWISDSPQILSMIAEGGDALKERIVNRLWEHHRHELPLNLCPVCKRIARTPKARQCRFCGYDWH